ncbi:MAG: acyl carrier protein [Myxococcaceae bacterium]|nr:acyl carrier protein [Myxococcaceae bacterium]
MNEELTTAIKRILVSELFIDVPENKIGPDDGLQSVLGLDSVGFLELRVLCEKRFNVQISDEDFSPDNFRSVGCLASLITRLQTGARAVG